MQENLDKKEIGFIKDAKDYLVEVEGLPSAKIDDLLADEDGGIAVVSSLYNGGLKALYLKRSTVEIGKKFYLKGKSEILHFGEKLFGRIINPLGEPLDGAGSIGEGNADFKLKTESKGIEARRPVDAQFKTGISMIDALFPLGRGQRQMLFGPIRSGKSRILTNIINNQAKGGAKEEDVVCIYAAIGKSADFVDRIAPIIFGENGNKKTIIISALSSELPAMISIAPSIALLLAEYFKDKGQDVFLALDDLGAHAKYLREISLLKGILPGRDSYPGDLFYRQAHIIERAGAYNEKFGGGAITLIPVLETEIESYSDFLSTNLISTTDGHLSCSDDLYRRGVYPPIMTEESVTRIGRTTQNFVQKQIFIKIISILSEAKKQEEYSRFGTQISEKSRKIIKQGKILREMLKQEPSEFIDTETQTVFLSLAFTNFFEGKDALYLKEKRGCLISAICETPELSELKKIQSEELQLNDFLEKVEDKISILRKICQ